MKQKTKKMLKIQSIMLIILILFQFIFTSVPSFALSISADDLRDMIDEMDDEELKKLINDMDEETLEKTKELIGENRVKELLGEDFDVSDTSLEVAKEIQEICEDQNTSMQEKMIKLSQKIKEIAPEDADMDKVSKVVGEILEIDSNDPLKTKKIALRLERIQEIHASNKDKTSAVDVILGIVDGIVGIFLNIFNIVPVLIGGIIQGAATSVASIGGRTDLAS